VTTEVPVDDLTFGRFLARVTAVHMVTYFVAGLLAFTLLNYPGFFQSDVLSCLMLPTSSKWVAAGPGLQVIRGPIFAAALYPFRSVFLSGKRGWLMLWGLLLGLAVFSTVGPAPGSVEGMIYTRIPIPRQLLGLPEDVVQTFAFAALLTAWCRRPRRAWPLVMGSLSVLVLLMSVAGVLVTTGSR
jgi:hypothetical protein